MVLPRQMWRSQLLAAPFTIFFPELGESNDSGLLLKKSTDSSIHVKIHIIGPIRA